jgi:hypothetical protein
MTLAPAWPHGPGGSTGPPGPKRVETGRQPSDSGLPDRVASVPMSSYGAPGTRVGSDGVTSDDLQAGLRLSNTQGRFLEIVRQDARWWDRASFPGLWDPTPMFPNAFQPWPVFISRAVVDTVAADVGRLAAVTQRALFRRATEDLTATAAALGEANASLLAAFVARGGRPAGSLRADMVETRNGFRCVELNISGALGGWPLGAIASRLESIPLVHELFTALGERPRHLGPLGPAFEHFGNVARARGGAMVVFGPAGGSREACDFVAAGFQVLAEASMDPARLPTMYFRRPQDLSITADGVRVSDAPEPIAVILEAGFPVPAAENLLAIEASGAAALYNGPLTNLLSDKRLLAFAHEDAQDCVGMTHDEAETVKAVLPRTCLLFPDRAQHAVVKEILASPRAELVLKRADSYGGNGVFIGSDVSAREWDDAVGRAFEEPGWILQERVHGIYRPMLGTDGVAPHGIVWGWFELDGVCVGVFPRVLRRELGNVVNVSRGGELAIAYLVDEQRSGSESA